jgi:cytochrome c
MYLKFSVLAVIAAFTFSCKQEKQEATENMDASEQSDDEWISLFDGKSTSGWRNFKSQETGAAWKVEDGALMLNPAEGVKGGDLITNEEYENFELSLEWKIDSCGNSGIIFNVVEEDKYSQVWETGPELQVLDNACHPDAKIIKHRAGDLYDLISCSTETVKPAGEWNEVRIVSLDSAYEFHLNGTKVVSFKMHTPEWDEMVSKSKFKDMPAFGKSTKGHIALQDHGDRVWFRNIKIRLLGK